MFNISITTQSISTVLFLLGFVPHLRIHKPPIGNGNHTYNNGDDSGMVYGIVLPTLGHTLW